MVFKYFKRFFYYFEDYKYAFIKYSVLSVIAAFLELAGVALTYPLAIKLFTRTETKNFYTSAIFIGLIVITLLLFKNLFMIFFVYIQTKFTSKFEIMIKKRVINFFLNSDYTQTSQISFAEKSKIFGLLIPNVMNNYILRLLNLNVNILIFTFISACIAVKYPIATIVSLLCGYSLIIIQNKIYKPLMIKFSKKVSQTATLYNNSYNEALLNIKNIKILGNEKGFYDNFAKNMIQNYDASRKINFLTTIPPYIIEPFAIVILFVLLLVISCQYYASTEKLIASFALVAAAIFRLTPAISRIQVNLNGINSALPMVKEFIDVYEKYNIKNICEIKKKQFCNFNKSIELKNVNFEYEPNKPILKNINLTINKGDYIGIAGLSGCGKTTLIDVISGLYKPQKGEILIDGVKQKTSLKIGYVPQEFNLISGNIRTNVAFGADTIDDTLVIESLKKAQLYDFIINTYEEGIYASPFVDSNGLSLGQRQRMAIARALYTDPDILIFDEATSSLDSKTENEVIEVLKELKREKTIIVVAHRLSTLKATDKIIFIENGEILEQDSYNKLSEKSAKFKELINNIEKFSHKD